MLQALAHIEHLEHMLFLVELKRHVCSHGIGEARGLIDARQRRQNLRRHLLVQLHVLIEQRGGRAHQDFHLALGQLDEVTRRLDFSREKLVVRHHPLDLRAFRPFDQNLHGTVGQLEQLQDAGQGPDLVHIDRLRLVDIRTLLRDQQDLLVVRHRSIQGLDRFFAAHEQRNDHMRVNHHVPQRQHRDSTRLIASHTHRGIFLSH